jgi:hypothetical protein
METKLCFILNEVAKASASTFIERFRFNFCGSELESIYPDLIRYICRVIHPSNIQLSSDIIQRWDMILNLLGGMRTHNFLQSAKLALFYDWLFFDPAKYNIMEIEPAILLIFFGKPVVTCSMIDFLRQIQLNFLPEQASRCLVHVRLSLFHILRLGVVKSIRPLHKSHEIPEEIKGQLLDLFPMLIDVEAASELPHIDTLLIPQESVPERDYKKEEFQELLDKYSHAMTEEDPGAVAALAKEWITYYVSSTLEFDVDHISKILVQLFQGVVSDNFAEQAQLKFLDLVIVYSVDANSVRKLSKLLSTYREHDPLISGRLFMRTLQYLNFT